ncbi:hypothetical protein K2X40_01195 [Candidatus Babeliales bacterium]|nr:hypothetical protein [Candidatus Babeliales bacterium]
MPFWLHELLVVVHTRRLSVLMRLSFTLGLLLAVGASWTALYFWPVRQATAQAARSCTSTTAQIAAQQAVLEQNSTVVAAHEQTKQRYEALVCTWQPERVIDDVLVRLKRHQIACKGLEPLAKRTKGFLEKEYLTLKMSGAYRNIVACLSELEQNGRAVKCKECLFKRADDQQVQVHATMRLVRLAQI